MPRTAEKNQTSRPDREDGLVVHDIVEAKAKEIHLLVDDNHLKAYVKIIILNDTAAVTVQEVTEFLLSHEVKMGDFAADSIQKVVEDANASLKSAGPILVANGRAALDGEDGAVLWLVANPLAVREVKAADRVDYRERKPLVNVCQGQKILRIVGPVAGRPGEDVFGTAIPCREGKPVTVKRGKNVDLVEATGEFFAQVAGMLEMQADTILVDPTMAVQADVDMTVGNINFIGPVKIARDVRDGFHVRAGKEIEIAGMVEGAIIESGAGVRIHGGVAGRGKARIICAGDLEARYLNEVYVEAAGDVIVPNSITNSTVKSLGKIMVNTGGIRGSNVVAQRGLKSPEIGSDMGVRTVIVVGVDYHIKDQLVNVERELNAIREAVEKIEKALGPLMTGGEILATLPAERADIARRLVVQLDLLVKQSDAVGARREALLAQMQVGSDFYVEIAKRIYPGVVMQIGTCRRTFELEVTGPMRLYPEIENASIKVARGS